MCMCGVWRSFCKGMRRLGGKGWSIVVGRWQNVFRHRLWNQRVARKSF